MAHHKNFSGIKTVWIDDLKTIRAIVDHHFHMDNVKIVDHNFESPGDYKIEKSKDHIIVKFRENLDLSKNFLITSEKEKVWAMPSLSLLNSHFATDEFLGARIDDGELAVSLWSPTATEVIFLLYDRDAHTLIGKHPLKRNANGVWVGKFSQNTFKVQSFDALFYQYEVTAFGSTNLALDPYAKSMAAFDPKSADKIGKAAIVNIEASAKINRPKLANETDFIAYEAHVRDFTIDPFLNIDNKLKGTYSAFSSTIPHLKDLGITHVQFMPLQNFFTVNEADRSFQGDHVPMERVNYNWGYDPLNYFTPEGWYSSNAKDPYARIKEVKKLISDLHQNGIGVILDVVYNHLYNKNILENVAPGCYLRKNQNGEISEATGAGVTLESRNFMARRLIIDSLKLWQNYYGVDGFRFDLMGFIDQETMKLIRQELGPESILYGEAWDFTDLPSNEATIKTNFPHEARLSVFNDSSRDSYAGQMAGRGFVQGAFYEAPKVKAGVVAGLRNYPAHHGEMVEDNYDRFAMAPFEALNYLAIHDGFTLWDKVNLSIGGNPSERERIVRMAFGMLLTSQGRIVLHGGDEAGRSKPLSPNDPSRNRAHTSDIVDPENGIRYFHENTYASPDSTNKIDWERFREFSKLKDYVKGLIELRRSTPGLRFNQTASVNKGLSFIHDPVKKIKIRNEHSGYTSFSDPRLTSLTVHFINAPEFMKKKRYYLAGEIHPYGVDKNPKNNNFVVDFDEQGSGSITFTRKQIDHFDLGSWGDAGNLQIKAVKTPQNWDYPDSSYSASGNNSISPNSILKNNLAVIDLSIVNHHAGDIQRKPLSYVAYMIDNTLEDSVAPGIKKSDYLKLLVVHNSDVQTLKLAIPEIKNEGKWHVLVDERSAGIVPLKNTEVQVLKGEIKVPRKSTVVIGGLE